MFVRLRDSGSIFNQAAEGDTEVSIERKALLVYEGEFESMDGPVKVSADQLKRLVDTHNSVLSKVKRLASGDLPIKYQPPIQVDHSVSGWDTVGRVTGLVELSEHELDDGTKVMGVFGNLRVLGKENVERVKDGRWAELSIGADFDSSKLSEVSFTPFPAAKGSALLRDGKKTGLSSETTETNSQTKEVQSMDREKLKAKLMKLKGLSSEEAEKECDRLSAEENKEELSRFAAECDEDDKLSAEKDEKEKQEKLTAAKTEMTRLSTDFRSSLSNARLAAKKATIQTKLSKLRASAKITPAEIKKMDITKLASSSQEVIDATLGTFEAREPVIHTGQLGSIKSASLAKLAKDRSMTQLEAETRANMSLLANADKNRRLSENGDDGQQRSFSHENPPSPSGDQMDLDPNGSLSFEEQYNHIATMLDQGNIEGAKNAIKQLIIKMAAGIEIAENADTSISANEEHLAALTKTVDEMQTHLESIIKLSSSITG